IRAAVNPVDIIDDMFIADVVSLEWEVLRWRRLKSTLIRTRGLDALGRFLATKLEYDQYLEHFVTDLTKILQDNLPEDQAGSAQTLACRCAQNEADAFDKVNEILSSIDRSFEDVNGILERAQAHRRRSSCKSTCGAKQMPSTWSMSFFRAPASVRTP